MVNESTAKAHTARLRLAAVLLCPLLILSCAASQLAALPAPGGAALPFKTYRERMPAEAESFPGSALLFADVPEAAALPADPAVVLANFAGTPGPAATPFPALGLGALDRFRASTCLTQAIYYEAASETDDGQRAVAQVVLNRVRHPAFPKSVCGVVYQGSERPGCQFSFACDGSMARRPSIAGWVRARRIADAALSGHVHAGVGLATNYHTLAVSPPWSKTLTPAAIIGAHIFYRLPARIGGPASFSARYAMREPAPGPHPWIASTRPAPDPLLLAGVTPAAEAPPPQRIAAIASPKLPVAADTRYVPGALPESGVQDKYRFSGMPLKP